VKTRLIYTKPSARYVGLPGPDCGTIIEIRSEGMAAGSDGPKLAMTAELWHKVRALFHAALEQPPPERDEFLRRQCGEDSRLYAEVRDLVEQHALSASATLPAAVPAEAHPAFAAGEIVSGRYRIAKFLGRGGMGEVYEAEDLDLKERVALKTLLPEIAGDGRMIARFKQEIQLSRKISHPNVCRVFDLARHPADASSPRPVVFLTMELLAGETLADRLRRETRLTAPAAFPLLVQMADALDAAHRAGVIHRDFKPSNVMLVSSAAGVRAVVTDFGLARSLAGSGETTATLTGHLMGTLDYMAPELLTGNPASIASDVYALGMVAYRMVTGDLPFAAETPLAGAILRSKVPVPAPRTAAPDLDPAFDRAIVRALDPDPARRFSSARQFTSALRGEAPSVTVTLPVITRRRAIAAALAATLLIAGGIGWRAGSRARRHPSQEALRWYQVGAAALRDGTYYRAVRALQRAVGLDPGFALAHARLAESWNELDDSEKSKQEMLRALTLETSQGPLDEIERLYIGAIDRTLIGDYPSAVGRYLDLTKRLSGPEQAHALVDLGRARERNDEVAKALEAYQDAEKLDAQNAAAHLRAAMLLGGRLRKLDEASSEFDRAAVLYSSLSNSEGEAEVLYQRGVVASTSRRVIAARSALEKALQMSRAISTEHQQIASLLQLSLVAYQEGDEDQAEQIAAAAVEQARRASMLNLASRGLSNLGAAHLGKGDYTRAEAAFREALEISRHYQMPRGEARALFFLANLHELQGATETAIQEVRAAQLFYHRAGFRLEESQCLTVLARANRDLGKYGEALAGFEQQLLVAQGVSDGQQIAIAEQGIASVLLIQERWTEALAHYKSFYESAQSIGDRDGTGRALEGTANVLWRLGRYSEAEQALEEANSVAGLTGKSGPLTALIAGRRSEMALSRNHPMDAIRYAKQAYSSPSATPQLRASALCVAGLALARARSFAEGKQLCSKSIEISANALDTLTLAENRLLLSEILWSAGELRDSVKQARLALMLEEAAGRKEIAWRAWVFAGRGYERLNERGAAQEAFRNASARLSELKVGLGPADFARYVERPDIRLLRSQLGTR
jgi:eukaryotic-like serine/threonine-protein kinase